MLMEEQIRRSLHADRVNPLGVVNFHGLLGLEQLAAAVSRQSANRGNRPISRVYAGPSNCELRLGRNSTTLPGRRIGARPHMFRLRAWPP